MPARHCNALEPQAPLKTTFSRGLRPRVSLAFTPMSYMPRTQVPDGSWDELVVPHEAARAMGNAPARHFLFHATCTASPCGHSRPL